MVLPCYYDACGFALYIDGAKPESFVRIQHARWPALRLMFANVQILDDHLISFEGNNSPYVKPCCQDTDEGKYARHITQMMQEESVPLVPPQDLAIPRAVANYVFELNKKRKKNAKEPNGQLWTRSVWQALYNATE